MKSCTSRMWRRSVLAELGILGGLAERLHPELGQLELAVADGKVARARSPRPRRTRRGSRRAPAPTTRAPSPTRGRARRGRGRASRRSGGRGSARRCPRRGRSRPSSCRGSSPRRRRVIAVSISALRGARRPAGAVGAVAHAASLREMRALDGGPRPHQRRSRRSRRRTRSPRSQQRGVQAVDVVLRAASVLRRGGCCSDARIAPISAMPSEPPTWRKLFEDARADARLVDRHRAHRGGRHRRHRHRHADAAEHESRAAASRSSVCSPIRW